MTDSNHLSAFIRLAQHRDLSGSTFIGFSLCTAGNAEYILAGKPYQLKRGSLFVHTPIVSREIVSESEDFATVEMRSDLEGLFPLLQRIMHHAVFYELFIRPCIELPESTTQRCIYYAQELAYRRRQLEEDTSLPESLLQVWVDTFVYHCITHLLLLFAERRASEPLLQTELTNNRIFTNFMMLLNMHFREERSVSFYAERMGYSTGHFSTLIRQQTGRPPSAWIASTTMAEARRLLEQSKMNIKQIASELGFPEQFTFRKYFKQHEGIAPKEYRKQYLLKG